MANYTKGSRIISEANLGSEMKEKRETEKISLRKERLEMISQLRTKYPEPLFFLDEENLRKEIEGKEISLGVEYDLTPEKEIEKTVSISWKEFPSLGEGIGTYEFLGGENALSTVGEEYPYNTKKTAERKLSADSRFNLESKTFTFINYEGGEKIDQTGKIEYLSDKHDYNWER